MCERCAELEERVAWLESELGLQVEASRYARLRAYMLSIRSDLAGRKQAVQLVMALHRCGGRTLSRDQLLDLVPPAGGGEDERLPKIIDVWVCFARRALGRDAIETVWGRGYRLTEQGRATVDRILSTPEQVAA